MEPGQSAWFDPVSITELVREHAADATWSPFAAGSSRIHVVCKTQGLRTCMLPSSTTVHLLRRRSADTKSVPTQPLRPGLGN